MGTVCFLLLLLIETCIGLLLILITRAALTQMFLPEIESDLAPISTRCPSAEKIGFPLELKSWNFSA